MRSSLLILAVGLAGLGTAGIGWMDRHPTDADRPAELRLAVSPDAGPTALHERLTPLVAHLGRATGLPIRLEMLDSAALMERFAAGEVDLALCGGQTLTWLNGSTGVRPLVARDVDVGVTSVWVARRESAGRAITDFRGRRFGFVDRQSTGGHLRPRRFLERAGIEPEAFFGRVEYTGSAERTVQLVQDGTLELGVVSGADLQGMLEAGRLAQGEVVVLSRTPPYVASAWVARPTLHEATFEHLREACLALDAAVPVAAAVLRARGCGAYLPVSLADLDVAPGPDPTKVRGS